MLDNMTKWTANTGPRLVKARSSPNVSKAPLSVSRKQPITDQSGATHANRSPRVAKTPAASKPSAKSVSNEHSSNRASIYIDCANTRTPPSAKPRRSIRDSRAEATKCSSTVTRSDKKQLSKAASSPSASCVILEDRTLLKKRLSCAPAKLPKKPEALRKKIGFDRSPSLGCVSLEIRGNSEESFKTNSSFSADARRQAASEKESRPEAPRRKVISRSVSLWSLQAASKNGGQGRKAFGESLKPSKIPLLAQRSTRVGRSLADLSQVDRAVETAGQAVSLSNDVDLDRSMDERIYENCRDALGNMPRESRQTVRVPSSNLEERVARLMAQLDDDDSDEQIDAAIKSNDRVDSASPHRTNSIYTARKVDIDLNDRSRIQVEHRATVIRIEETSGNRDLESVEKNRSNEKGTNKEGNFEVIEDTARGCKHRLEYGRDESQGCMEESRKKKEASNIQELKKTWEKQMGGTSARHFEKKSDTGYVLISPVNAETLKATRLRNEDAKRESKNNHLVGKRTKEIEHLVNFFNCKNAETSREAKDLWIKSRSTSNTPTNEAITTLKKNVKSMNDYNGYTSDGNCSEDSGHMSNENEVEWKESIQNEGQEFDKERFFEQNELRGVGMFNSTVAGRLEPGKKTAIVASSVSSSCTDIRTDSCKGENTKAAVHIGKDQWKAPTSYNDGRQVWRVIINFDESLDMY